MGDREEGREQQHPAGGGKGSRHLAGKKVEPLFQKLSRFQLPPRALVRHGSCTSAAGVSEEAGSPAAPGIVVCVFFSRVPASQAVLGSCPVRLRQQVSRLEPDLRLETAERRCSALSVRVCLAF